MMSSSSTCAGSAGPPPSSSVVVVVPSAGSGNIGAGGSAQEGASTTTTTTTTTTSATAAVAGLVGPGYGHTLARKTFHKPTYCHSCTDMLWGILQQGYICEVCNFVVHERCVKSLASPCSSIAANLIKNPVAHCWSEPVHHRKKFCNVCRKKLDDGLSVHCEICEYFVHMECQDFAVADCKENATYLPGKELASVRHTHHWREGNLPTTSKCVVCKKNCFSAECLAGYRCEWCGMTAHAPCSREIPAECTFGMLEPIYLPPHAVSIPRTEVPMEAIIGVQVRRKEVTAQNSETANGTEQLDFAEGEGQAELHDGTRTVRRLAAALRWLSLVFPSSCHGNCHASPPYVQARSISEEFSSGDTRVPRDCDETVGLSAGGSSHHGREARSGKEDKERGDEETIKVYDGNNSVRHRLFRVISVPRQATTAQILTLALQAFHITRDSSNFYLTDLYTGEETPLTDPAPILGLTRKEGKRPAVFLRFKDVEYSEVRVYPGKLQVSDAYCTVPVTEPTTVADIIKEAIHHFRLENDNSEDYRCSEILLDRGVTERVLELEDKPLEIVKHLGRDSIRQMELMRFYLQLKQDPHGPNLALFVGNLPPNLSERMYENMLMDFLGKENKFSSIGPIYYEYGSMVITYEDSDTAVRALYTLRESKYEEKYLLVMLLPSIEPSMVPANVQPLLVFVNVKSGGCQGLDLISNFRKLLNPYQVFDLDNGGPLPGLYVFRHIENYKILVCGGDGTVGWVLQCLDNVGQDSECSSPACAIVPLGTGNDLARVLRWGSGYTGGEDPLNLLRDVIDAEKIRLDRWTVVFHPEEKEKDKEENPVPRPIPNNAVTGMTSEDNTQIFVMNNYFGIGLDAALCLDFHNAREENPNKFNSRLHNKSVYVKMGLKKMVGRKPCKDLHREIRLEVDGKVVDLPQVEGIIILNILSWGSGANPWGPDKEDQFNKPNHWDGILEVVGVTGVMHLGQIQSGLRNGMRIAQGGHIKIHLHSDIPVQVDGEPWLQSPGDVVVLRSALKATMLKKNKVKRRNTEPAILPANGEGVKSTNE
ncbi:diacylglycerol kinase theta [Copidosoma floridanum]|uniref:diacylglycerol kinase theta n=1 Tax=Copidosoma floridanum TaxID=29053 RepID=UPI0006C95825|nr:diacylglycerol kinase theta [Copidosoma floridanum]